MSSFEKRLQGGHPNSLGNTIDVVEEVLADPSKFDELFNCYFSDDEIVRLRVSNAMKRIAKANKSLLLNYLDRFIEEISKITQPSAQWTLAQLFLIYEDRLLDRQKKKATEILKMNLEQSKDWIVLNMTMDTLGKWANNDKALKEWLRPHLLQLSRDKRKSVNKKANKLLQSLDNGYEKK